MSLPCIGVTAQGRPSVTVSIGQRASVASVTVPGEQGGIGKTGDPGTNTGFGQITYTERMLEASDLFTPNVRGQILFTPTSTNDDLNPPFKGHVFWHDNRVVARAPGDLYDVQINLIVTSQVAGGQLRLDADVGSSFGPIASDTQVLFSGALDPERVTFRARVQVLDNFLANGCRLYLTSSVPITTISETVLIAPASIQGPGPAASSYVHAQANPSSAWIIAHNLGRYPTVTLVDSAGDVFDADTRYVDANTIAVTLNAPTAGTAYLN